jgi:hypothetical protein
MFQFKSRNEIERLFHEIYAILVHTDRELDKPWVKINKIEFFSNYTPEQIESIIMKFTFLTKESWNHIEIDKIEFILESLHFLDHDIAQLSKILNYSSFEKLVKRILALNEYSALNNFRFSDKSHFKQSTSQGRYEVDVVGLSRSNLLLIDAKQWNKRDPPSAINKAANLQYQRAEALKRNPDIVGDLMKQLSNRHSEIRKHLPLIVLPIMVTLEESNIRLNDNHIPVVSIYRLNSFLQELSDNLYYFNILKISKISLQTQL